MKQDQKGFIESSLMRKKQFFSNVGAMDDERSIDDNIVSD